MAATVVLTAADMVEGLERLEVRLEGPPAGGEPEQEALVRFAPLGGGITSHACEGVGFPDVKQRQGSESFPAGVRDSAQLKGELRLGANLATGLWELQLDQNPLPPQPDQESPWPGISGTAVLVGDCLVGVAVHELREGSTALTVHPLQDVLADPGFCAAVSGTSQALFWSDAWGVLRPPHEPLPKGARLSPAVLLRPEFGVVPFKGRREELESPVPAGVASRLDRISAILTLQAEALLAGLIASNPAHPTAPEAPRGPPPTFGPNC